MGEEKEYKTKVLMLVPSMGSGGAERVMATLANELTQRNYDITILTLTTNESFYSLNSDVTIDGAGFSINRKNKITEIKDLASNGLKSLFFFKKYIREYKPDIILSFLTHTNIISLLLRMFDRNIPLVISERADPEKRSFLVRLITKYLYQTANILVCQSNKVTDFFPKNAQRKIKVIPNPISTESIIQEYPVNRRKAIVGIGRLFPQKNFSLLIDSFNDIKDEYPDYILEIYGEGYFRDQLKRQIHDLGLEDRAFLMGRKQNVMKYVYDAELFVMSSDFEGFPNVLIEAMGSGLPVISTDFPTGVASDLIKDDNGIVVPVGDRKEMSNAIRKILSSSKLQKSMSIKNREIIDVLSTKKIVDMWMEIFEELKK